MKKYALYLAPAILAGCAYGPKVEHKTPLDVLNGQNYEAPTDPEGLLVPIVKRKERQTHISGNLMISGDGSLQIPLRFVPLKLMSDDKMMAQIRTDNDGKFLFAGVIPYEIENLLIHAQSKK